MRAHQRSRCSKAARRDMGEPSVGIESLSKDERLDLLERPWDEVVRHLRARR